MGRKKKVDDKLPSDPAPGAVLLGKEWAKQAGWRLVTLRPRADDREYQAWQDAMRKGAVIVDVTCRGDYGRQWWCAIPPADASPEKVREIAQKAGMLERNRFGVYSGPTWPWQGLSHHRIEGGGQVHAWSSAKP
jgi:hypothetical protein